MPALAEKFDIPMVNMHEAKTQLSRIAREVERGDVPGYVVARHGVPVVKIVRCDPSATQPARPRKKRIGVAEGKWPPMTEEEAHEVFYGSLNDEMLAMFKEGLL